MRIVHTTEVLTVLQVAVVHSHLHQEAAVEEVWEQVLALHHQAVQDVQ